MIRERCYAWYNEHDNFAATWLENLINARLIAPGFVDRRDVQDVRADDLREFTQLHFFAGIGGWSRALRLAGWRDTWNVCTISCPCQPWSSGRIDRGKLGEDDARDLWPTCFVLLAEIKPQFIFGEQVANGIAKRWIERTRRNLKSVDYHFYGEKRKASDYGSPQQRERVYFSANIASARSKRLVTCEDISTARSWRWRGEKDLRIITERPFERSDRWPEPLICKGDDGISGRVGQLRAYGNAIDPHVTAQFIHDTQNATRF